MAGTARQRMLVAEQALSASQHDLALERQGCRQLQNQIQHCASANAQERMRLRASEHKMRDLEDQVLSLRSALQSAVDLNARA